MAAKAMKDILSSMKNVDLCEDLVTVKSVVNEASRNQMKKLALEILNK